MSELVESDISILLEEAHGQGRCLVPSAEGIQTNLQRAIERRADAGILVSPARGLYADRAFWKRLDPSEQALLLARGLQALHPDWVFCGPTAAMALGVDVSTPLLERLHIGCVRNATRGADHLICRHAYLPSELTGASVDVASGIRVTEPNQTVFDCLRRHDFPYALGIADSALRTGLVDQSSLERFIDDRRPRIHGKSKAKATLAWADARSENGGESIARARMILLGYVVPELQVEVPKVEVAGNPWRADYCWMRADGSVILGELDGKCKYQDERILAGKTTVEALTQERLRESRISLYDAAVMRFSFELTRHPTEFAALLDAYGVPKAGSMAALPPDVPMVPDWDSLRRSHN